MWREYYECTWTMNKWWVHLFHFNLKYEETIMNVHERWICDESIFSISTLNMKRLLWMHMNDELVMSPSFPFQLKIWRDYYECTWTMN